MLSPKIETDRLILRRYNESDTDALNKQSSRVMEKAEFKKDGYIANRRLNKDGKYSGVLYYSKTK